ncbi:MAG TPA: histidine ammonia-lyase [Thermoplasmata archaeon]|nr:histidine ammonia-lyase [Thermoplasmata archaeon]
MTEPLALDGRSLTLDQFLAVARGGRPVSLAATARPAVEASRHTVERAVKAGRPVYGVTTGFGSLSQHVIPPSEARGLQLSLLRSHASGTGPALPADVVRGMLLLRANALGRGHSGVRPELVERLLEFLNRNLLPFVPEQGSVGASGDLAPLAHLALTLQGEGEFVDLEGRRVAAAEIHRRLRLTPLDLAEKEGVALINGTSLMTSYLALSVADGRELLAASEIAAALSFDALRGDPSSLDDRLGALRNLPEQRAVAEAVRRLLHGSQLAVATGEWHGQDPYTLRCIPQVMAATCQGLDYAERTLATELNSVSDNPVVFESDEFVSGGNFHGQTLALALDTLALALHYLGAFAERRVARLVNPALNRGLPAFLAPTPGRSSGFMIPQYLAAALVNENQTLVHPASASSLPTSADQEDYVSMGAWAGAKLRRVIGNIQRIVAIEWIVAGQALEYRRPQSAGAGSEAAWRVLRERVASLAEDRSPAADIERMAAGLVDGSLVRQVRALVPF